VEFYATKYKEYNCNILYALKFYIPVNAECYCTADIGNAE
jgi:hypothetical protein